MDVVVLASTGFESLPTVLLEAGTLGRRIVATDVGGVREIVRDGHTGLVVEHADPTLLAAAINRVLEPDGAHLAAAARTEALTRFGQVRFTRDIAALYEKAVGLKAHATKNGGTFPTYRGPAI
jgi:glycosyltransferase involved in cell wall biosynthesis